MPPTARVIFRVSRLGHLLFTDDVLHVRPIADGLTQRSQFADQEIANLRPLALNFNRHGCDAFLLQDLQRDGLIKSRFTFVVILVEDNPPIGDDDASEAFVGFAEVSVIEVKMEHLARRELGPGVDTMTTAVGKLSRARAIHSRRRTRR